LESDKNSYKRIAKLVIVGFRTASKGYCSKSVTLNNFSGIYPPPDEMSSEIMRTVFAQTDNFEPVLSLSLVGTKFLEDSSKTSKIYIYFKKLNRHNEQNLIDVTAIEENMSNESEDDNTSLMECSDSSDKDEEEDDDSDEDDDHDDDYEKEKKEDDLEHEVGFNDEEQEWKGPKVTPELIERLSKTYFVRKIMNLYNLEDSDLSGIDFKNNTEFVQQNAIHQSESKNFLNNEESQIVTNLANNECEL